MVPRTPPRQVVYPLARPAVPSLSPLRQACRALLYVTLRTLAAAHGLCAGAEGWRAAWVWAGVRCGVTGRKVEVLGGGVVRRRAAASAARLALGHLAESIVLAALKYTSSLSGMI